MSWYLGLVRLMYLYFLNKLNFRILFFFYVVLNKY